jgi:hypothetical protein
MVTKNGLDPLMTTEFITTCPTMTKFICCCQLDIDFDHYNLMATETLCITIKTPTHFIFLLLIALNGNLKGFSCHMTMVTKKV